MRARALVVAALVGSILAPGISFAEGEETPSPHAAVAAGERVRLFSGSPERKRWTGRVLSVTQTGLVLGSDGIDERPVRLSWSDVSDVQVSRGTYGHPGTGAIVGGLVALPVAAFLSGIRNFDCQSRCYDTTGPTVAGTLVGVGLGAMVGLAVRSDRWERPSQSPQVSLGVAPVQRGVGATLAVRF